MDNVYIYIYVTVHWIKYTIHIYMLCTYIYTHIFAMLLHYMFWVWTDWAPWALLKRCLEPCLQGACFINVDVLCVTFSHVWCAPFRSGLFIVLQNSLPIPRCAPCQYPGLLCTKNVVMMLLGDGVYMVYHLGGSLSSIGEHTNSCGAFLDH